MRPGRASRLLSEAGGGAGRESRYSLVFVDGGVVLNVVGAGDYRRPVEGLSRQRRRHPGAARFVAALGQFDTAERLRGRVEPCAALRGGR